MRAPQSTTQAAMCPHAGRSSWLARREAGIALALAAMLALLAVAWRAIDARAQRDRQLARQYVLTVAQGEASALALRVDGAVARLPIFASDAGGDPFWGFAQVLIRMPELLAASTLGSLPAQGLGWRLSKMAQGDDGATVLQMFAQSSQDDRFDDPVMAEVPVANGRWLLEIAPHSGWSAFDATGRGKESALAAALSLLGGLITYSLLRAPVRLAREVDHRTRELSKVRERLDLALEGANLGLWDWQPETDQVEFNQRRRHIVRAPASAQLPGTLASWAERVHHEDLDVLQQAAKRQMRGEIEVFEAEFRLRAWDNTWNWVESRGRAVERDAHGLPKRAAGTNRDVSERKAVEEQLQPKSKVLEVSANAIPITDPTGVVEWIDPGFTALTGFTADDARGQAASFHKSGMTPASVYRDLRRTILAGQIWQGELVNRRKDGSLYQEIQTIAPVFDASGRISHFASIKRDVTARRQADAALRERERLLDAFFSQSLDGFVFMLLDQPMVWRPDADPQALTDQFLEQQRVTRVNRAMLDQYGADEDDLLGRRLIDFFAHDVESARNFAREFLDRGQIHKEAEECRLDSSSVWIEGDYTLLRDDEDRIVGHIGVQRDVTERRAMADDLTRLATTDLLTGLPNRRYLMERLHQDFARFERAGAGAALLMLDLDFFKKINDTHGQAAGDAVLAAFAGELRRELRRTDTAGRLGGEEFALLLHAVDEHGAAQFAERLRSRVETMQVAHAGAPVSVTVSIGVALFAAGDESLEATLLRADAALYQAKSQGRNRVHVDGRRSI